MAKRIVDEEMRFQIIVNGSEAQKELYDLEKATRDLRARNKELRAERTKLSKEGKRGTQRYKELTAEIDRNSSSIKENNVRMDSLQKEIGITGLSMAQLTRRAAKLRGQLRHMIPGSADHKRLQAELKETSARMRELRMNSKAASSGIGSVADKFNRFAAMGAAVIATLTGVVLSVQKMIDYMGKLSDAQADVRKTTGLTKEEVDDLTKSFGMFTTRTSRIELLKLAETAGRLGIVGQENIMGFVKSANQLKVALGDDLSDTAIQEVGKMVNVYKVAEKQGKSFEEGMLALGSSINEVSASGANQAGFLVEYLKRQSGVAIQTKISAAENIGYAATFDEIGQSVEVSATAMNKIWMDLFENTGTYAEIAGMSLKDFNNLLQTDSNEAMIRFLEGLNGNNDGLSVMIEKMEGLQAGGARGVQALSALSASTDLLRERQRLANTSLKEATSLTDEYNIKNNNLAATIDKVKKRLIGMFSGQIFTGTLSAVVTIFGRLIGAIDDVNEKFEEESRQTYESAKANRQLAMESAGLLEEYESLTKDGITPTAEEKERLEIITLKLSDRLGKSVMMVNEETGAYELNTEAVRQQIKVKRLAADEEASMLASRLVGAKEELKTQRGNLEGVRKEFLLRKKMFEEENAAELEALKNSNAISAMEKEMIRERMDGYRELEDARNKQNKVLNAIEEQEKRRLDLAKKLKELNYSEADIEKMFSSGTFPEDQGPKEGATQIIGGQLFVYKNGQWRLAETPTTPGGSDKSSYKDRARELIELQRQTEDNRIGMIQDAFEREMTQADANHRRKIQDLRAKKIEESQFLALNSAIAKAEGSGKTKEADALRAQKQTWLDINAELDAQILQQESLFQSEQGKIILDGLNADLEALKQKHAREKTIRKTDQNEQLAALGSNEEAKKALREQFAEENAQVEKRNLEELIAMANQVMASGEFEGFDLDLLTDEQTQQIKDNLTELGLSLSQIDLLLKRIQGKGGEEEASAFAGNEDAAGMDLFGFTAEDWVKTFENLDTVEGKLAAVSMATQGMMNAWSMYHQFVSANENRAFRQFEARTQKRKQKQEDLLNAGLISQRQYDNAVEAMEKETEKRRAEMEYKQAKREWQYSLGSAIAQTASAVAQALPNIPLSILVGAIGALQIATVAANKPVKGYEKGLYRVQREQDGKWFDAEWGGESRSGMVDRPTVFMAGEQGKSAPEMIISGKDYKGFAPDFRAALHRELARVKGFENGYYPTSPNEQASVPASSGDLEMKKLVERNSLIMERTADILNEINETGITAFLSRDLENAKKIREDIQRYEKLRNKNKI